MFAVQSHPHSSLRESCEKCRSKTVEIQRASCRSAAAWLLGGDVQGQFPEGVALCRAEPSCDALSCEAPLRLDRSKRERLTQAVRCNVRTALENDLLLRANLAGKVLDWVAGKVFVPRTVRIEFSKAVFHAVLIAGNAAVQLVRKPLTPPSLVDGDVIDANVPSALILDTSLRSRTLRPADLIIIHLLRNALNRKVIPILREACERAPRQAHDDTDSESQRAEAALNSALVGERVLRGVDLLADASTLFEEEHGFKSVSAAEWLQSLNMYPGCELLIPWIVAQAVRACPESEAAVARVAAVGEALLAIDRCGFGVDVAGQLLASCLRVGSGVEVPEGVRRDGDPFWGRFSHESEIRLEDTDEVASRSMPRWLARSFQKAAEIRGRWVRCSKREERFARRATAAARVLLACPPPQAQQWHWLVIRCLEYLISPACPWSFPPGTGIGVEDLIRRVESTQSDFAGNKDAAALVEACARVLKKAGFGQVSRAGGAPVLKLGSMPSALDSYLQRRLLRGNAPAEAPADPRQTQQSKDVAMQRPEADAGEGFSSAPKAVKSQNKAKPKIYTGKRKRGQR